MRTRITLPQVLLLYVPVLFSTILVVGGLTVVYGWVTEEIRFIKILESTIAMQVNTALCFILVGLAIILFIQQKRFLVFTFAFLVLLFSIITLIEDGLHTSIYLNEWLLKPFVSESFSIQRMAPNTAVCFVMLGLTFFVISSRQIPTVFSYQLAIFLCSMVLMLVGVVLFGYAADVQFAQGWQGMIYMALQTAVAFVCASSALILVIVRVVRQKALQISFSWLILTVGVVVSIGAVTVWQALILDEKVRLEELSSIAAVELKQSLLPEVILVLGLVVAILMMWGMWLLGKIYVRAKTIETVEKRLSRSQQLAHLGSWIWNIEQNTVWCSAETLRILGLPENFFTVDAWDFFQSVRADDQIQLQTALKEMRSGRPFFADTLTILKRPNQEKRFVHIEAQISSIVDKVPVEISGTIQDITDFRKLEEQLVQAQKMEIVGQMTGGIAHDFNNLLMAIRGNLDLLSMHLPAESHNNKYIEASCRAIERGADLTKRLLAFSRRQILQPKRVEVSQLLDNLKKLLKPILSEAIETVFFVSPESWTLWADEGQLENALINLAMNARDAMSGKGKITFNVSNITLDSSIALGRYKVEPGEYVKISVTDVGCGIAPEVIERVFEPFFTTKEVGKGSGLGLSMVYGFVKQSRGHITIYSEVGIGTTVSLYLPRAANEAVNASDATKKKSPIPQALTNETILVVEDEEAVRTVTSEYLEKLGYRVLEANNGPQALRVLKNQPIHLLFSDVVMPGGITGLQLVKEAKQLNPALKILLASGYPKTALIEDDIGEVKILTKPYQLDELARSIRHLLDSP